MMRFNKKFSDYMTFQLNSEGYADVTLFGSYNDSWDGLPYLRVTDELTGNIVLENSLPQSEVWEATLRLRTGLYRIECGTLLNNTGRNPLYLGRGQVLRHIGVGELFAIAGQSNAAGYGRQNEVDDKDTPSIGVSMKNDLGWQLAAHPIGQMDGNVPCSDMLLCGHSPWLRFARYLTDSGTPVGLLPAAKNGTSISDWQPGGELCSYLSAQLAETRAGNLIWMQGCNDVHDGRYKSYYTLLDAFLSSIKQAFPLIKITIIQISGTEKDESFIGWKTVRDAQRLLADKHGCRLVPSYDLSEYSDDIHLSGRSNLRLARRSFKAHCGSEAPRPLRVFQINGSIVIKFSKPLEAGPLPKLLDNSHRKIEADIHMDRDTVFLTPKEGIPHFVTLDIGVLYRPLAEVLPLPCVDFLIDLSSL